MHLCWLRGFACVHPWSPVRATSGLRWSTARRRCRRRFPSGGRTGAPQSIGGCGQSVGAACTAGDCSYLVPCQSQAGTCMPVQTCMPNVCTVDTVCCPTAFVNCPSNHATCAPNCTRAFPCGVSHAICGPSRFEPACQFATNAAACQIVASGPACPQVESRLPAAKRGVRRLPGAAWIRRRGGICAERRLYISVELQPRSLVSSYAVGYLYVNNRPSRLQPHERRPCWV